jgi:uncharacterized protein YndB with AHSA1/START domain
MSNLTDVEKRTLTLERTFDAPRDLVWKAWTQPEHIMNWWTPPGMQTTIKKHDFVVGGEWEYSMKMPDGKDFISFGKYLRIEKPSIIEMTANFLPMTENVTILAEFIDAGEKTEFVFRVIHATEEYCKQQEDMGFYNGWGSVFEGLNKYLGSL